SRSAPLISRGIKNVRAVAVDCEVGRSRIVIHFQNLRPAFAAVSSFVYSALGTWSPEVSGRRDPNDIGICRMNNDASNVHSAGQAHQLPRFAGVEGLIYAISPRRALTVVRFAAAGPDYGRAGGRYRDITYTGNGFLVEKVCPRCSAIGGFQDAAGSGCDIDDPRIIRHNFDIVNSAAHGSWADLAKLQARDRLLKGRRRVRSRRRRWGGCRWLVLVFRLGIFGLF